MQCNAIRSSARSIYVYFYLNLPPTKPITAHCLHIGRRPKIPLYAPCKWENKQERMWKESRKVILSTEAEKQMGKDTRRGHEGKMEVQRAKAMDNVKNPWSVTEHKLSGLTKERSLSLESQRRCETTTESVVGNEGKHSDMFAFEYTNSDSLQSEAEFKVR